MTPRTPTIGGFVHAPLRARCIEMTDGGDVQHVGIARIYGDLADVLCVGESDVRPRAACIRALVDAVAIAVRVAQRALPAADVDRIRRGRRNGNRADGRDRLRVEDRQPRSAAVDGLPYTAVDGTEVELIRPAGNAGGRCGASSPEGSQRTPPQSARDWRDVERRGGSHEPVRVRVGTRAEEAAQRGG